FLTQVQTMGIGGGLRAAGNNLSVVAAMLNPLAGVVVGVGTAISAILIPKLMQSSEEVEKLTRKFTELARARTMLEIALGDIQAERIGIPGAFDDIRSQDRFADAQESLTERLEDQRRALKNLRREFLALGQEAGF